MVPSILVIVGITVQIASGVSLIEVVTILACGTDHIGGASLGFTSRAVEIHRTDLTSAIHIVGEEATRATGYAHLQQQIFFSAGAVAFGAVLGIGAIALQATAVALLTEPSVVIFVVSRRATGDTSLGCNELVLPIGTHITNTISPNRTIRTAPSIIDKIIRTATNTLMVDNIVKPITVRACTHTTAKVWVLKELIIEARSTVSF